MTYGQFSYVPKIKMKATVFQSLLKGAGRRVQRLGGPNPACFGFPKPSPGLVLGFSPTCPMPVLTVAGLGRHIEGVEGASPKSSTLKQWRKASSSHVQDDSHRRHSQAELQG